MQDEITNAVALAIEPAISLAEQRRAMGASPDNLAAWETYHRALSHLARGSDAEVARARELFQRATELDELFAPAHALLAVACLMETGRGLRKPQDSPRLAEVHVRRAIELDPYDSHHWPKILTPNGYANRLCLDSLIPAVAWETSDGGVEYHPDGPDGRAIASGGGSGDEGESGPPDPGDRDGAGWLFPRGRGGCAGDGPADIAGLGDPLQSIRDRGAGGSTSLRSSDVAQPGAASRA